MQQAQAGGEGRDPAGPEPCFGGHQAARGEEGRRGEAGDSPIVGKREPDEAAEQPAAGQHEQRPPGGARAALAREERERDRGQEVLGREREVGDTVVEGPETGVHEVGVGGPRRSRTAAVAQPASVGPPSREGSPQEDAARERHHGSGHAQRDAAPAPAVDHADADPAGVQAPVATTKPML